MMDRGDKIWWTFVIAACVAMFAIFWHLDAECRERDGMLVFDFIGWPECVGKPQR